jgi:hypothetical protein
MLVPKGDCAIEPAADDGVADPEPNMTGVENVGAGGICTRSSGAREAEVFGAGTDGVE